MPRYRVIYTNGEKQEIVFRARKVEMVGDGVLKFLKENSTEFVALIPVDKILCVVELEDE